MAAILIFTLILSTSISVGSEDLNFTFNGFRAEDLIFDGVAEPSNRLLQLTNFDSDQQIGHAFYPNPISFKNQSNNSSVFSFSTTFVFAIRSKYDDDLSGQGLAFVVSPSRGIPDALRGEYLGLFNKSSNGNETSHIFAVELDTIYNEYLNDTNNNHVGIDINSLVSKRAESAGYWDDVDGELKNLTLISGKPMQVWMEYDGFEMLIHVTMAPIEIIDKPNTPLLSLRWDLSSVFEDTMYVGFSSSTGAISTTHYILGWSFRVDGEAQSLDLSQLPKLPIPKKPRSKFLTKGLPLICLSLAVMALSGVIYFFYRRRKFAEILEDWEQEYGPIRFKYKDLYKATKGFREKEILGVGGFGRVYKGVLPNSKIEVAVKKISHESKQGMKEFVAEIVSVGHLRHRNVVGLLGYCRRKGELFLVYEYMPNGSLDRYLHDQPEAILNWGQRFEIIKGVASGLFYLHEQCEQVVIHRDVKASNVLLDAEFNARLGDFGLAKLYDRGADPRTTNVVGTLGYLAPELMRTGRATTRSDVYAFGAFLLEVACGSRPIQHREDVDDLILMDWVFSCWTNGNILRTADRQLRDNFEPSELELVLKLGLLCSHSSPAVRPTMHQVLQYLEADAPLPDLTLLRWRLSGSGFLNLTCRHRDGNDADDGSNNISMSYPFLQKSNVSSSPSVVESILIEGR